MCKWIFSLFHGRNESLLLWIHKLKSPCVGEELNGGAHSVNSSVLARISAGRFAVTWHYWEVTAVTISSRLVIFCQWKNELAIGGWGGRGRAGLSDQIPAWLANDGKTEWKFCLSPAAITLPSTPEWCNDLPPHKALTQSFCCNMFRSVTLSCILAHEAGTTVYIQNSDISK